MDDRQRNCGRCRFFVSMPQAGLGMGNCFCLPPQMLPTQQGGQVGLIPVRPVVRMIDACGQFMAREQVAPEASA